MVCIVGSIVVIMLRQEVQVVHEVLKLGRLEQLVRDDDLDVVVGLQQLLRIPQITDGLHSQFVLYFGRQWVVIVNCRRRSRLGTFQVIYRFIWTFREIQACSGVGFVRGVLGKT